MLIYERDYGTTDAVYFPVWLADGTRLAVSGDSFDFDAADLQISKDGGAFANVTGTPTMIGDSHAKYVPVAADLQCKVAILRLIDADGVVLDGGCIITTRNHPSAQNPNGVIRGGTAQAGAAGSITLASGDVATDDILNGTVIEIVSGTGAGQSRVITDSVDSTDVCSVEPNWVTNPSSDSVYRVWVAPPSAGIETAVGAALATYSAAKDSDVTGSETNLATLIGTPNVDLATDLGVVQTTADSIEADTQDIQSRIPAALTGSGSIKAALQDEAQGGTSAVLTLKNIVVENSDAGGIAVDLVGSGTGNSHALRLQSTNGKGMAIGSTNAVGLSIDGGTNAAEYNATELLAAILAALSAGFVEVNIKKVNDVTLAGDGGTTPWGP